MTTPSSPPPPRRPDGVSRSLASALLKPLLAVVGITVVLTVLFVLFVWSDGGVETRNATPALAGPPTPSSPAPATPTPATPASTPSSIASPSAAPPSASPPTPTPSPTGPPVVVVDQSGRAGLADRVAGRLRGSGWRIERVGVFRGNVSTTTVYYPDGQAAAARAVARALAKKARTLPRLDTISETSLTVVLTDDYPS